MAKKKDAPNSIEKTLDTVAIISENLDIVDTMLTNHRRDVFLFVAIAVGVYVYNNERRIHFELSKIDKENEIQNKKEREI